MGATNYAPQGWIARTLAKARRIFDGNLSDITGPRVSQFQEQYMLAAMVGEPILAEEGSLVMTGMLPAATALQLGLSASYAATAAAIVACNNAPVGSGVRMTLRDIHFTCNTPPTSGTQLNYATFLDNVNRAPTTISGLGSPGTPATQTAYLAPSVCPNMDENPQIQGRWWFPLSTSGGAPPVVPAQGPNARCLVGQGILRAQIPVALDDYRIVFGATDRPAGQLATAAPNGASRIVEPHPAVVLGPQQYFLLYLWAPSNATAGLALAQLDCTHYER